MPWIGFQLMVSDYYKDDLAFHLTAAETDRGSDGTYAS